MAARLKHSGIACIGRPVVISYDGTVLPAVEGETIAAALAAGGIKALRHTRDGQRRGLYCGMGVCQECLVTVDGRASQRACMTKVRDGQVVRSLMPMGTADDPLVPLTPAPHEAAARFDVDVLVLGAGPAGLSAALAARRAGASVTVLDERMQPGGQFYKPLAPSHRSLAATDKQFARGLELTEQVGAAGVEVRQDAQVWAALSPNEVGAIVEGRATVFTCRKLIIAPGAYERPTPFPGWTLPGVMTTGAAQTLARAYRVSPGQRVVIAVLEALVHRDRLARVRLRFGQVAALMQDGAEIPDGDRNVGMIARVKASAHRNGPTRCRLGFLEASLQPQQHGQLHETQRDDRMISFVHPFGLCVRPPQDRLGSVVLREVSIRAPDHERQAQLRLGRVSFCAGTPRSSKACAARSFCAEPRCARSSPTRSCRAPPNGRAPERLALTGGGAGR